MPEILVQQSKPSAAKAQRFKLEYLGSGRYVLASALDPSLAVAVKNNSAKAGAGLVLARHTPGSTTQAFKVKLAG
ncbi:MAG: RICIN domain-containing protein [Actinomycetia bacterium]|nr:RICIN domain-containing protein [Actinomycetes bacterium]